MYSLFIIGQVCCYTFKLRVENFGCSIQNRFAASFNCYFVRCKRCTLYNCGTKVMHTCRYLPQKEKIVKQENNCCLQNPEKLESFENFCTSPGFAFLL